MAGAGLAGVGSVAGSDELGAVTDGVGTLAAGALDGSGTLLVDGAVLGDSGAVDDGVLVSGAEVAGEDGLVVDGDGVMLLLGEVDGTSSSIIGVLMTGSTAFAGSLCSSSLAFLAAFFAAAAARCLRAFSAAAAFSRLILAVSSAMADFSSALNGALAAPNGVDAGVDWACAVKATLESAVAASKLRMNARMEVSFGMIAVVSELSITAEASAVQRGSQAQFLPTLQAFHIFLQK